jgi:hypothetical protein
MRCIFSILAIIAATACGGGTPGPLPGPDGGLVGGIGHDAIVHAPGDSGMTMFPDAAHHDAAIPHDAPSLFDAGPL